MRDKNIKSPESGQFVLRYSVEIVKKSQLKKGIISIDAMGGILIITG